MNSETRTKVLSWLRSPKSLVAKAGIGLAAVAVVSVGTVSAMTVANIVNEPETRQNNAAVAENEPKTEESANNTQESPKVEQNQPETTTEPTAPTNSGSTTAPSGTSPAPAAEPEQPAPAVYADTYPADLRNAAVSSKIDQWGMSNRQSVSYTAFKVAESAKTMPKWGYTGRGDASYWPTNADNANIARGTTPKVGSVGVSGNFTVYVEAVNGDKIDVSFYNWNNSGAFGYWNDVPASQFATYIYF